MIHHERLRPSSHDYPADEWNIIEKKFNPEFLAQLETMLALGNGYLGMRGCPEEGGPNAENSTLINGFYETRPIVYPEDAYGFDRQQDHQALRRRRALLAAQWEAVKLRPTAQHEVRDARSGDPLGDACRQTSVDYIPAFGLFRQ
jgi:hypothetical protein